MPFIQYPIDELPLMVVEAAGARMELGLISGGYADIKGHPNDWRVEGICLEAHRSVSRRPALLKRNCVDGEVQLQEDDDLYHLISVALREHEGDYISDRLQKEIWENGPDGFDPDRAYEDMRERIALLSEAAE